MVEESGKHREEIRTLSGRVLWTHSGSGQARYDLRGIGRNQGVLLLTVSGENGRTFRKLMP